MKKSIKKPRKIHSASVVLIVPKLEALSINKLTATRTLKRLIVKHKIANKHLTHITEHPCEMIVDDIEMTPAVNLCIIMLNKL